MVTPSQPSPLPGLLAALSTEASAWLADARKKLAGTARDSLPVLFPQLPRRLGRNPFADGVHEIDTAGGLVAKIDLGAWRACDGGALLLLAEGHASEEQILDLYYHGDMEEKAMVFRAVSSMPLGDATITLLGEAQRTNTSNHFEAAVCDSNLLARAVGQSGFSQDEFNRVVLKLAFTDVPLARTIDVCDHADVELSRMLQGLATEREAAGRRVWRDTNFVIAHAPTDGTLARIAGGLEHGDDAQRLSAALGLAHCGNEHLLDLARQRLDREPVLAIRSAIQAALA